MGQGGQGRKRAGRKKVACACLRASQAEGEAACRKDTTAGLNGATYNAATWDEHCGEAEQAPSESDEESRDEIRGCTCLKEFPTRVERDRHIIETLEAGCHAITPDELPAIGAPTRGSTCGPEPPSSAEHSKYTTRAKRRAQLEAKQ